MKLHIGEKIGFPSPRTFFTYNIKPNPHLKQVNNALQKQMMALQCMTVRILRYGKCHVAAQLKAIYVWGFRHSPVATPLLQLGQVLHWGGFLWYSLIQPRVLLTHLPCQHFSEYLWRLSSDLWLQMPNSWWSNGTCSGSSANGLNTIALLNNTHSISHFFFKPTCL